MARADPVATPRFYVALLLAAVRDPVRHRAIWTRAERHEGMVAAIAFESVVKLVAFLAVGLFVDLRHVRRLRRPVRAAPRPIRELARAAAPLEGPAAAMRAGHGSIAAVDVRDRVPAAPVPGRGRRERRRAPPATGRAGCSRSICWRSTCSCCRSRSAGCCSFPAGGRCRHVRAGAADGSEHQQLLALLVFLGGLSAATGMVIVETIALSAPWCATIWSCRCCCGCGASARRERGSRAGRCSASGAARSSLVVLLGYAYFRFVGESLRAGRRSGWSRSRRWRSSRRRCCGGIYWKRAHARGVLIAGLSARLRGLDVHAAAALVRALGLAAARASRAGAVRRRAAAAARAVRPRRARPDHACDVLDACSPTSAAYVGVSLLGRPVDARAQRRPRCSSTSCAARDARQAGSWRGTASARRPRGAAGRFLGASAAREAFAAYARERRGAGIARRSPPTPRLVRLRRDAARRRDRRGLGARDGRLGREEEPLGTRRGDAHPRRDLAGDRIQPPARAEVARARGRHRGAARRERAAAGARPAEGRLRLHGEPRAAHAAHLDPRVRRDPARQPGPLAQQAPGVPRHHRQGDASG